MNYSKMHDVEISQKVWFWLSCKGESPNCDGLCSVLGGKMSYLSGGAWIEFDPCNSWADAGRIIESQEIGLVKVPNGWCATHDADAHGGVYTVDKNPLRAAMIVFLMMQEGE